MLWKWLGCHGRRTLLLRGRRGVQIVLSVATAAATLAAPASATASVGSPGHDDGSGSRDNGV